MYYRYSCAMLHPEQPDPWWKFNGRVLGTEAGLAVREFLRIVSGFADPRAATGGDVTMDTPEPPPRPEQQENPDGS